MNPEAQRCLLCKNARCAAACPVHTDIPAAMKLYREDRLDEAARLLFDNNPLTGITCQVCDWNRLCFGHCVLNAKKVPVHWYEIEQEISVPYLETATVQPGPASGKTVAILGAGPAGIAAAIFLRKAGHGVRLYDEHPHVGGVLRYGIPDFRLDKRHVDHLERILLRSGVEFRGGRKVTATALRGTADALLIAGGATQARKMRIPGEELPCVLSALEYLEAPEKYPLRGRVIVVGGGNVAMDACRTAKRQGCEVTVYYRKTIANMPANTLEIAQAQSEGIPFEVLQVPVGVELRDGQPVAIVRNCENVTREDGSLATRILDGTDHEVPFDTLIVAVSEKVDYRLFGEAMPDLDPDGWVAVDPQGQTSWPGVFLAGDFRLGPKTVVQAVESAKTAVQGILDYLG